jgi:hypothetical protein
VSTSTNGMSVFQVLTMALNYLNAAQAGHSTVVWTTRTRFASDLGFTDADVDRVLKLLGEESFVVTDETRIGLAEWFRSIHKLHAAPVGTAYGLPGRRFARVGTAVVRS